MRLDVFKQNFLTIRKSLIIGLSLSMAAGLGNWLSWLDVFAHFQFHLAILGLILACIGLFARYYIMCISLVALSIYHFALIIPWYFPNAPIDKERGITEDIRILSFNVNANNNRYAELIDYIEEVDPDILCIFEAGHHLADRMKHLREKYPVRLVTSRKPTVTLREIAGFMLWSKYPVTERQLIISRNQLSQAIRIQFEYKGQPVELFAIHPHSPKKFWDFYRRNMLFKNLPRFYADTPHRIVIGDFNTTLNSAVLRNWQKDNLRNVHLEVGLRNTWPSPLQALGIAIDHAYISDTFRINEFERGPFLGSDHLALELSVSLEDI